MKNFQISIYCRARKQTHTHTPPHTRLLPIWTPDLFQPSDGHWHLPLERSLLTFRSWWEWMMLLLEEKKGGKGEKGGGGLARWKEVGAPRAGPGIHLDPLLGRKVTGRPSLTSSLQRSRRRDLSLFSCNMALLLCHTSCHSPSLSTHIRQETCGVYSGTRRDALLKSVESLSLKTVAGMEGCTWSAVVCVSEERRMLSFFTEGAFWWLKQAGQQQFPEVVEHLPA